MMKRLIILIALLGSFVYADGLGYDKNTTCLVRQLPVYKAPRWVAKIEVANGKVEYFCSPKSMFEFYHRPSKWFDVGVKKEEDFEKIIVTDYETFKPIDAKKAYYVYGSRAISPAGDDLVPFKLEADAKNFAKEYSGKRILRFSEIKDTLIRLLNGRI
jgi:nitrous oxide reductase accessory protein NosL